LNVNFRSFGSSLFWIHKTISSRERIGALISSIGALIYFAPFDKSCKYASRASDTAATSTAPEIPTARDIHNAASLKRRASRQTDSQTRLLPF
jgi:hypothetical protein